MADLGINKSVEAFKEIAQTVAQELISEKQEATADSLKNMITSAVNQFKKPMRKKAKTKTQRMDKTQKMKKAKDVSKIKKKQDSINNSARQYHEENPELNEKDLKDLLVEISPDDSDADILAKITAKFKDPTNIDQAISFLIDNTDDEEFAARLNHLQERYEKDYGREIQAGKNISEVARKYAKEPEEPTELRNLYRDITGNPREPKDLFTELSQQYKTFKELNRVIKFLFHALGQDLNTGGVNGGPSMEPGKLKTLIDQTKTLQAIKGIYVYFKQRFPLITKLFAENDLEVPKMMNFQDFSKQFINLLSDRYPTSDKVASGPSKLGINTTAGKIIAIEAERDAVRSVSKLVYNSVQHRNEVFNAILEALEQLYQEEEFEEEEAIREEEIETIQKGDTMEEVVPVEEEAASGAELLDLLDMKQTGTEG